MKAWLALQLEPIRRRPDSQAAIVLDPDLVLSANELSGYGDVVRVTDWYSLRQAYEQHGRRRPPDQPKLILLVQSERFRDRTELAYDLEQSSLVVRITVPAPLRFRPLVRDLPDALSDKAVEVLREHGGDNDHVAIGALLLQLWGASLGGLNRSAAVELDAVVRLRSNCEIPESLWPLVRSRTGTPLAQALADQPPNLQVVQDAWDDWLFRGSASSWSEVFGEVGPSFTRLVILGLVHPAIRHGDGLPGWAVLGARDASAAERLEELLDRQPDCEDFAVAGAWTAARWIEAARWWGGVRLILATGELSTDIGIVLSARQAWSRLDTAFVGWLRKNLGQTMLAAAGAPPTVDKIAGWLARRLRDGRAKRVMLVVADGMAFSNWAQLMEETGLTAEESHGAFAMIPTSTSISRQALFAGRYPRDFSNSLRRTDQDQAQWRAFWREEGLAPASVGFATISGSSLGQLDAVRTQLSNVEVMGLVLSAVDEMLHGSNVLGDRQVHAGLAAWAKTGFMAALVQLAELQGFEVWLTADHGNLEAEPLGKIQEGLAVDSAGLRVRWYASASLREASGANGILWDPPGLPKGVCSPLFAPGRGGYFTGDVRVTHGGLSLDEVIVPLVKVAT
jgi:hypothetical protein